MFKLTFIITISPLSKLLSDVLGGRNPFPLTRWSSISLLLKLFILLSHHSFFFLKSETKSKKKTKKPQYNYIFNPLKVELRWFNVELRDLFTNDGRGFVLHCSSWCTWNLTRKSSLYWRINTLFILGEGSCSLASHF